MRSLRHLLPSAGNLIVFETAGRLLSFTAAGRELGMTQAAVSYAVRSLEDQLGVKLFRRGHRQVLLTEAGDRFLADVTLGLEMPTVPWGDIWPLGLILIGLLIVVRGMGRRNA